MFDSARTDIGAVYDAIVRGQQHRSAARRELQEIQHSAEGYLVRIAAEEPPATD